MRRFAALTGVILIGPLAACRSQAPPVGNLSEEDVAAIERLVSQREASARAPTWDPLWEIYERDALFVPPYGSPISVGEWTAAHDPSDVDVVEFSAEIQEIDGRGDLAFLRGTYVEVMSMTEGVEPHPHTGTFVWLVRKKPDGSWRVFMSLWNEQEYAEEQAS